PDQDNFLVLGDEIFTWQDELLTHYEMLPDGALANISSSMLPGAIERVISDAGLLWVRVNHAEGPQWLAIETDDMFGGSPTSSRELVVAPGKIYFDVMADGNTSVWSRNIEPVSDEIQIAVGIEPLPHVVQFTIDSLTDPIGDLFIHLETTSRDLIPARREDREGHRYLVVARDQLKGDEVTIVARSHTSETASTVVVDRTPIADVNVPLATATTHVTGAQVPLTAHAQASAVIGNLSVVTDNQSGSLALGSVSAYQWITLPAEEGIFTWALHADEIEAVVGSTTVVPNNSETSSVTILSPINNI